jgi:ribonuclease HI
MTETVTIFTDGAASPNPGRGGYGIVLIQNGQRRELSGGFVHTTNNRMELVSVIVALQHIPETAAATVFSDSKYVVDNLNGGYAVKWRSNQWRTTATKQPAKNADLWKTLLKQTERIQVKFIWVKSHAENPENNRCDELAVLARQIPNLPRDEEFEKLLVKHEPPMQMHLFEFPS